MKMRVASGGIRTHDTLYSGQMLYQLTRDNYQPIETVHFKHQLSASVYVRIQS